MNGNADKILIILDAFPALGGVAKVSCLLAGAWQRQGYRVDILALRAASAAPETGFSGRCRYLPDSRDVDSPRNREYIRQLVTEEDYRIILNQGVVTSTYLDFCHDRQHRFVNVLHGCPAWLLERPRHMSFRRQVWPSGSAKAFLRYVMVKVLPWWSDRRVKRRLKTEIEASAAYVVLTESYKKQLEDWLYDGQPQDNIQVIANPVVVPPTMPAKGRTVLFAGRYTKADKHPERLLRVWKRLATRSHSWTLRMCGEGPEQASLRRLARRLKLGNVQFLPPCLDDRLYEGCSLLAQTSSYEGMSLVVLEAQAAGVVPVVFDSGPWLQTATVPGKTACVVPAFDVQAFADALYDLMTDTPRREAMADAGRQYVGRFDSQAIAAQWTDLFNSLL